MSLINQMLQNIEKRQGEGSEQEQLPSWVPAAVAERKSTPTRRVIAPVLLALLLSAAGFYFWKQPPLEPAAPGAPIVLAAPVAAAPVAAAPVAAAPVLPPTPPPGDKIAPAPAPAPVLKPQPAPTAKLSAPKADKSRRPPVKEKPAVAARQPGEARLVSAKPGSLARSAPENEAHELAEQLYRNALNAYSQGRTNESLTQAQQALMAEPTHLNARQLLIRQLIEQRDKEQARAVVREGVQLHPAQVAWTTLLARLELDKGDLAAARRVVDQATPQASASADFQSMAGAIAQRQGRPDEAAEFYRNALRLRPAEGRNWVGLGLALEADGHATEAREAFRRALASEGLSPDLQALAQRKAR